MFRSLHTLALFFVVPMLSPGIVAAQDRPTSDDDIEAVVAASLRAVMDIHDLAQRDAQEIRADHIRVRLGPDAPRVAVYAGIQAKLAESLGLPLVATTTVCERPVGTILYSATVDHMSDRAATVSAQYFQRTTRGHGLAIHQFSLERTDSEWVVVERLGLFRSHGRCD